MHLVEPSRTTILYARGAGDDKSVVAGAFQVFVALHRLQVPLDRDVIFLGVADEEAGGMLGITYLLENHPEAIDAEIAINEAGKGVFNSDHDYVRFEIQTAEKTPRRIDLLASGTSGHGSIPLTDNPVGTIARAVGRLFDFEIAGSVKTIQLASTFNALLLSPNRSRLKSSVPSLATIPLLPITSDCGSFHLFITQWSALRSFRPL